MNRPEPQDWRGFYEKEAGAYDSSRYGGRYGRVFRELHRETLAALLAGEVPGPIVEVAAGTGHTSALLCALGFRLFAVDLTPGMLARAREVTRDAAGRASFVLGSAFQLPFADGEFRAAVSTRFLHLWGDDEQLAIVREMARVVAPGGAVLVDFNNRGHQDMLRLPIALYQRLRGRRDQDEHYNRIDAATAMLAACGLSVDRVCGVGGYQLAAPALLSHDAAVRLGRAQRALSPHFLAEQFVVLARKA